jgi:hypothetical protein
MAHDWLDCLRNTARPGGRRQQPRIPAPGVFCTEISDEEGERYAMIADVSPVGVRLHRPYNGQRTRTVQLEFELPGADEVVWARGLVCFDQVWQTLGGQVLQTTGVEIVRAASKHLKLLREYAFDHSWKFAPYLERRVATRL